MRIIIARSLVAFVLLACSASRDPEEVSLERTGCYGICPQYRISIRPNGAVSFSGAGYQDAISGRRLNPSVPTKRDTVESPAIARAVFGAFDAGWARWQPNRFQVGRKTCPAAATDHPTVYVVRRWADRSDTVEVYFGCPHVPGRLVRMAAAIDSLSGVQRWLGAPPHRDLPAN